MTNRKPRKLTTFLWHRRVGLLAIVLVITLAITGIMLNHTEDFKLDKTFVDSALILDWYGLEPEGEPVSFSVNGHSISQWQKEIFFDDHIVTSNAQKLRGAIHTKEFIVVAFDHELLLLTDKGETIERIPTSTSFKPTVRLGIKYERPVIETQDTMHYIADEHIIDWDVISENDIVWSTPVNVPMGQREALLRAFRGNGLSLERVILDLHSGRIFGHYGIYLMDAAAVALLWLSLSGLWVWWSRRQKQKSKRHYRKHHRG